VAYVVQEPDTECLVCMLDSMEDIIGMMGPQLLSLEQLSMAFDRLAAVLDESFLRRSHRLKRQQAEDFDEEEAEALQVHWFLLHPYSISIGKHALCLFASQHPTFSTFPLWDCVQ
jgi:Importin repeat 6